MAGALVLQSAVVGGLLQMPDRLQAVTMILSGCHKDIARLSKLPSYSAMWQLISALCTKQTQACRTLCKRATLAVLPIPVRLSRKIGAKQAVSDDIYILNAMLSSIASVASGFGRPEGTSSLPLDIK